MRKINRIMLVIAFLIILASSNCAGKTKKQVIIVGKAVTLISENNNMVDEKSDNGKLQVNKQSVGIMTCIDEESKKFVSLCHGLYSNGKLIDVENGACYKANNLSIKKSEKNSIGDLKTFFDNSEPIGTLNENTHNAVYGKITDIDEFYDENLIFDVASKMEVKLGKAKIYLDLFGDGIEKYDIEIEKINYFNSNQNLYIRIIDERLIELTGGVVKGMSGSPIIQNGKFVGAINYGTETDTLTGCAIFAENLDI